MPMSWAERESHRVVEARMLASEAIRLAKPVEQPHPWRAPEWACRGCGVGQPLGGFGPDASLDRVMSVSVGRDGAVWGREVTTAAFFVTCGPNCWGALERAMAHSPTAPKIERVHIDAGPAVPKPVARSADEVARAAVDARAPARPFICGSDPKHTTIVRAVDPAEVERVLRVSGWVRGADGRWYCGRGCASLAPSKAVVPSYASVAAAMQRSTAGAPSTVRAPVAVERLADASYQGTRSAAGAPPGFMNGRDMPTEVPAKPAKPKGAR